MTWPRGWGKDPPARQGLSTPQRFHSNTKNNSKPYLSFNGSEEVEIKEASYSFKGGEKKKNLDPYRWPAQALKHDINQLNTMSYGTNIRKL